MVFLILAASAYSPLRTWANASESPSLLTLAFAYAVIAVIGLLIWVGLQQLRLDPMGAGYATTGLVLLLTNAGVLIGRYANGHLVLLIGSLVAGATKKHTDGNISACNISTTDICSQYGKQ